MMRLTNLADELRREHPWLKVVEIAEVDTSIHVGSTWKSRGHQYAGSGPKNVTWHHTASAGSQIGILRFELYKYSIPGNNINIAPDGTVYILAAGSTATNGAVTQLRFSRGMGGNNSDSFTMEIHNPGNGSQPYPQAQIDAAFAVSNTVNRLSGNRPTDLCTHHELAPGRKTDPAPASAMRGTFRARACTSAGTWHHDDLRAEAARRSSGVQPPPPPKDDDMTPEQEAKLDAIFTLVQDAHVKIDALAKEQSVQDSFTVLQDVHPKLDELLEAHEPDEEPAPKA